MLLPAVEGSKVPQGRDVVRSFMSIERPGNFPSIVAYDVMSIPALVIDEEVVLAGRIPSIEELRRIRAGDSP